MDKKTLLIFAMVAAMLVLATGCALKSNAPSTTSQQPLETIKIGVVFPLSGDAAVIGEQSQKVLEYALPLVNQKAAEKGKKFELIYEDGKCSGNDAVGAYQKLVDVSKVKFIIGGICSSETLAMAPLTKEANGKVLTLSTASSNPAIEGASPYTLSFSYSDDAIGKTVAKEMSKYNKLAIITEQNDYNIGIQKVWQEDVKQYPNVQVVADEVFPKGATDFRVLLEKVKNTQPEAILLNPNPGVTSDNLLKQLAEIKDWTNFKLFGQVSYISEDTRNIAPNLTEGMYIVDAPNITDQDFTAVFSDIKQIKGTVDDIGVYYTASTMDVINVLTDLILELGDSPVKVREALTSRTLDGYVGKIYFGQSSFPGVPATIFMVKNGKLEQQ